MPVNVLSQSELFIKVLKDSYLICQVLQTHLKICKHLNGSISTLQTSKRWKIVKCFDRLKFYQVRPLPTYCMAIDTASTFILKHLQELLFLQIS